MIRGRLCVCVCVCVAVGGVVVTRGETERKEVCVRGSATSGEAVGEAV